MPFSSLLHCKCLQIITGSLQVFPVVRKPSLQSLTGKYREIQGNPVMKAGFSLWELTYRVWVYSANDFTTLCVGFAWGGFAWWFYNSLCRLRLRGLCLRGLCLCGLCLCGLCVVGLAWVGFARVGFAWVGFAWVGFVWVGLNEGQYTYLVFP